MRTFILCVERFIHFPPEIYRIIAAYLYYKQHWPDADIIKYNKVMKQLPYPSKAASAPRIIYQSAQKPWRCQMLNFDMMFCCLFVLFLVVSRVDGEKPHLL